MNHLSDGLWSVASAAHVESVHDRLRGRSRRQRELVAAALAPLFQGATLLDRAIRQALFGDAKRVRASLALMATEAAGGAVEAAVPMAVAFELLHTASLIHDDIMDGSETRRGRPCVHLTFGVDLALTAGDALIFGAYQQLLALAPRVDPDRVAAVMRIFTDAAARTCHGQADDLRFPLETATIPEYLEMIDRKTGSMLAAPLAGGAVLAGAPAAAERALHTYGTNLGIAFQIIDHAIDYLGSQPKAGKTVGNDLRRNAASAMLIYCRERSDAAERSAMAEAIAAYRTSADAAHLAPVRLLFRKYDAVGFAVRLAQRHADRCAGALSGIADGPGATDLRAIAAIVGDWGAALHDTRADEDHAVEAHRAI
jgi:geranylgeranyl pyrophosphate synthase